MQQNGNCFSRSCVCTRNVRREREHPSHFPGPDTQSFQFEDIIKVPMATSYADFIWVLEDDVLDTVISSQ